MYILPGPLGTLAAVLCAPQGTPEGTPRVPLGYPQGSPPGTPGDLGAPPGYQIILI